MFKKFHERLAHAEIAIASRDKDIALSKSPPLIDPAIRSNKAFTTFNAWNTPLLLPLSPIPDYSSMNSLNPLNPYTITDPGSNMKNDGVSQGDSWEMSPQWKDMFNDQSSQSVDIDREIPLWPSQEPLPAAISTPNLMVDDEIPHNVANALCQSYFETPQCGFFMLDKDQWTTKVLSTYPLAPEFMSLKYAIMAQGASLSSAYSHLADACYRKSRRYLEDTEIGDNGGFVTIAALQTCILISLYELQHTLFIRALGSVSRVVWVAQVFQLHKMDQLRVSPSTQTILPPTTDLSELEERRRTFWATFNLSCFASIATGWPAYTLMDANEITTHLPAVGPLVEGIASSALTLNDALSLSGEGNLSATHGLIVTSAFYGRCISHVSYSHHESTGSDNLSYDFWMHHYHINESVNHLSTASLAQMKSSSFMPDSTVLCSNMNIQATLICLHHAAIARVAKTNVLATTLSDSENRCINAALEITSTMRLVCQMNLSKISPFIPWVVYVALQVFVRSLHSGNQGSLSGSPTSPVSPIAPRRLSFSPMAAQPYPIPVTRPNTGNSYTSGGGLRSPGGRSTFGSSNNGSGSSASFNNSRASTPSNTSMVESLKFLLSALTALKATNALAGVFETQIHQEIDGGAAITNSRHVGRVNFPLDGSLKKENVINDIEELPGILPQRRWIS
ncbi:hypothetical protein B7494_g4679 [Chlorociboria aeruginascens]|nr:hypothetical protein B7494_g4679 [Chlorociboria aeruginascens]